ncbi:MAG: trypsin-like peptidase domain-containing protein [Candidatus Omnitrophica bacterium]|nr:trypsin-like peptidase domain-containing protein [Candidatus Omnitrophota bacterium]
MFSWNTNISFAVEEMSAERIFAERCDSVVLVGAAINKKSANVGSGFIVSPDGLIVTNYHVVKNAKTIAIKLKNAKCYPNAKVINFDSAKDVAVLKIQAGGLKSVDLGNSDWVKIGEKVVVIGNPLGLESTISDGLISSIRTMNGGIKLLQTSVPLSSGSSGSPLFNLRGEVIGVNVSGISNGQNLNFAVPINSVRWVIKDSGYSADRNMRQKWLKTVDAKTNSVKKTYTVKPKDTLYGIAKTFNTTVERIMDLNGLSTTKISVGRQLRLPAR